MFTTTVENRSMRRSPAQTSIRKSNGATTARSGSLEVTTASAWEAIGRDPSVNSAAARASEVKARRFTDQMMRFPRRCAAVRPYWTSHELRQLGGLRSPRSIDEGLGGDANDQQRRDREDPCRGRQVRYRLCELPPASNVRASLEAVGIQAGVAQLVVARTFQVRC